MTSYRLTRSFPPRLWIALVATGVAFFASLLASINLYLLEDGNPLTQAAYSASPLLRFSYDGAYLSALVAAVVICAIIGYAVARTDTAVYIGIVVVSLLIILGGFGGLLIRYPATFFLFLLAFVGLTLISLLVGRAVAARSSRRLGQRPATIVGACVSAGIVLFVNVVTLVAHTLALNPANHALYMQGQIDGTHFNAVLISMGIALLTLLIYGLSIGFALRSRVQSS